MYWTDVKNISFDTTAVKWPNKARHLKIAFSWTVQKLQYGTVSGLGHLTQQRVCGVALTWMATMAPSS